MLTNLQPIAIGLTVLVTNLIPVLFLWFAATTIARNRPGNSTRLLVIGTFLLGVASLDSAFQYFGAYLLDTAFTPRWAVYTGLLFEGLKIVSLLTLGAGLIRLSKKMGRLP